MHRHQTPHALLQPVAVTIALLLTFWEICRAYSVSQVIKGQIVFCRLLITFSAFLIDFEIILFRLALLLS